ncbi:MAG: hypothetical protein EOO51_04270 [Flavobacterium sp.]|nr:MAG: hypothetical protein EOO51_04270 [Flavobacterium sp.]
MKREYTNGEVTIVWQPHLCIHSGICAHGLPGVFRPKEKPWVTIGSTTSEDIISQVSKCPSGALTTYINPKPENMPQQVKMNEDTQRFELNIDGETAVIEYKEKNGIIYLNHTEVPSRLGGKGVGKKIVEGTLNLLRDKGIKVAPLCSFVAAYIARHPEYQDMVAPGF